MESREKWAEAGFAIAAVGIWVTIIAAGFYPFFPKDLPHRVETWLPVLAAFAVIAALRLVVCVFVYFKKLIQWVIFVIFASITMAVYISLIAQVDMYQQQLPAEVAAFSYSPDDFMKIDESRFLVEITCDGNAEVVRTQTITPQRDLERIIEMDFYSSGGLTIDDIDIDISRQNDDGRWTPIPNTITEFRQMSKLVNEIDGHHALYEGQTYRRVTTINARDAYVDQDADEFIIVINHQVNLLDCTINFSNGCSIDPESVKLYRSKRAGTFMNPPDDLQALVSPHPRMISAAVGERLQDSIMVGDVYRFLWEYVDPPDIPADGN